MKKWLSTVLTLVFSIVLVASFGLMLAQSVNRENAEASSEQAVQLAGLPVLPVSDLPQTQETPQVIEDEPAPLEDLPEEVAAPMAARAGGWQDVPITDDPHMEYLSEIDLTALREQNGDVLGWIYIPNGFVNYPLMDGDDNSYYLTNTWDQIPNSYGSIFLEQGNSSDLTDFNTILYGHNMGDEHMFGSLKHYSKASYWQEYPYVYLVDDAGVHRYEIFAAYETPVRSVTYALGFDNALRQSFIDSALERSVIDTGITPVITNRILTLSTCTGYTKNTRWVVQARLVSVQDAE